MLLPSFGVYALLLLSLGGDGLAAKRAVRRATAAIFAPRAPNATAASVVAQIGSTAATEKRASAKASLTVAASAQVSKPNAAVNATAAAAAKTTSTRRGSSVSAKGVSSSSRVLTTAAASLATGNVAAGTGNAGGTPPASAGIYHNTTVTSVVTNVVNQTVVQVSTVTREAGGSTLVSTETSTLVQLSTVTAAPVTQTVGAGQTTVIIVQQITFFSFTSALGGVPPNVIANPNNNGTFVVAGQAFGSLNQAASAACTIQFQSCATVVGQGFSITDCQTQLVSCQGAAATATVTALEPTTVTQTVTAPQTAVSQLTSAGVSIITITTVVAPPTAAPPTQAATTEQVVPPPPEAQASPAQTQASASPSQEAASALQTLTATVTNGGEALPTCQPVTVTESVTVKETISMTVTVVAAAGPSPMGAGNAPPPGPPVSPPGPPAPPPGTPGPPAPNAPPPPLAAAPAAGTQQAQGPAAAAPPASDPAAIPPTAASGSVITSSIGSGTPAVSAVAPKVTTSGGEASTLRPLLHGSSIRRVARFLL